jgi:glutamate/tyrosine decarboxylase-like PLP-dependent enzyme
VKKYQKRLKSLTDLRRYLSAQIAALDAGLIDENRLRCVAYALSILASIVKDGDLERRVESLEKQAAENQPGRI